MPTADNIAYIDQMAATETGVDFTAYPKELTKGKYYVYLVGGGTAFNAEKPAATFQCDQKFTLGDVDEDGDFTSKDALWTLQAAVYKRELTASQFKAADVDRNGELTSKDALRILQYAVKKITSFD